MDGITKVLGHMWTSVVCDVLISVCGVRISILETSLNSQWSLPVGFYKDAWLELLDAHFKAIPSLKEVVIHDYTVDNISNRMEKKMRDYGLAVKKLGDSGFRLPFMTFEKEEEEVEEEEEEGRRKNDLPVQN